MIERGVYLVIALVAALWFKDCYDDGKRREGRLEADLKIAQRDVSFWTRRSDSLEKHLRDTVKLTQLIVKRVPIVDQIQPYISTMSPVPAALVHGLIVADDSTINQCRILLSTALSACDAKDSVIAGLNKQVGILAKQKPSGWNVWFWRLVSFETGRLSAGKVP